MGWEYAERGRAGGGMLPYADNTVLWEITNKDNLKNKLKCSTSLKKNAHKTYLLSSKC